MAALRAAFFAVVTGAHAQAAYFPVGQAGSVLPEAIAVAVIARGVATGVDQLIVVLVGTA